MKRLGNRIVFAFVCLIALSIFGFPDTNVSGIISIDTTWTKAASPYIVTDSIIINQGKTLTIEPGVVIKFEKGKSLRVDGVLIARGTAQDKITFTSNANPKNRGDWGAIFFSETSTGPSIDTDGNYIAGSILENCKVEYGGDIATGVLWYKTNFILKDCIIENNSALAIHAYLGDQNSNISKILKNIIKNNSGGIGTAYLNCLIQGNLIVDNNLRGLGGLYVQTGGNYKIRNNIFINNSFGGSNYGCLQIYALMQGTEFIVCNNSFIGNLNGGWGSSSIYISDSQKTVHLLNNSIVLGSPDNQTEIYFSGSLQSQSLDFHNNNIFNNSLDYSFLLRKVTFSLDAKNNWWGTTCVFR